MKKYSFMLLVILIVMTSCSDKPAPETNAKSDQEDQLTLAIGGEPDGGFDPTTGWGRYGSPLFQSTLLKQDHGNYI